ncbi:type II toxin-antitoxin system VapC family toxin [Nitrospira sp. BLG_2]|uniref:type II toxin-antitoxin system VapC family toxin n=1 Tax=Nitrospira sp. BLG_2 TaxID=3397507 RepID=UPI003B991B22
MRDGTTRKTAATVNLVVDTSVWSLVLRRPRVEEDHPHIRAFRWHVESGDGLFLTGNILQELLDGLRSAKQFDHLLTLLDPYPLLELTRSTYIAAARLRATCRAKGVNAGPVDFLIAATCCQHGFPLLTADQDFAHIARHCDLITFPA